MNNKNNNSNYEDDGDDDEDDDDNGTREKVIRRPLREMEAFELPTYTHTQPHTKTHKRNIRRHEMLVVYFIMIRKMSIIMSLVRSRFLC